VVWRNCESVSIFFTPFVQQFFASAEQLPDSLFGLIMAQAQLHQICLTALEFGIQAQIESFCVLLCTHIGL
jgi:hypothetical protein